MVTMTNFTTIELNILWSLCEEDVNEAWYEGRGRAPFMLLGVLKHFDTWDKHAVHCRMKAPTMEKIVMRIMTLVEPVLTRLQVRIPSMTAQRSSGKLFMGYPEALYATDVKFQPAYHPSGNFMDAKRYFSGKHHLYGYKIEASVAYPGTYVLLSSHAPASVSDMTMFMERLDYIEGRVDDAIRSIRPKTKPRSGVLTRQELERKCRVSSDRVLVENMFGRTCYCGRARPEKSIVSYNHQFDRSMANLTALHKFRFTIAQLEVLSQKLELPAWITTNWSDKIETVEAFTITCRRLAEPCRLYTVANEVAIVNRWGPTIELNQPLLVQRGDAYARAIQSKSQLTGVQSCIGFIYGTKQYISRPRPRQDGDEHENLQRSVYNGRPRRHCLNWQGITTPDGIIVTMSHVLDTFQADPNLCKFCLYGDPAYGCRQYLCCPFLNAPPGSQEAAFNTAMSSVREAVEWSFHLVKDLLAYLGRTLLTNCHTCFKQHGNQISMYFDMKPRSLDEYLGAQ
ncbi:Aste57867_20979 [Aphanomyces stellatus]|uniref:Aste57867_20979 protein n=1 Tax=Aphanomyces stellatus TaxID=120398 RepID=A0A485LHK4_9STRA|nr:hypothetical protein As57867_020911 [Aphanomyces stellatus]VFT97654.1 Aste57867_20979 [Aphanomyces stellatus]